MKKLVTVLILLTNTVFMLAQNSYSKLWNNVEQYRQKDQPKSALAVIDTIYKRAQNENNEQELIKSIIHKMKFLGEIDENARVKIINSTQDEIKRYKTPVKNILQCFLAKNLWAYYQNNQWKFNDRTTLAADTSADIETWSLARIEAETKKLFLESLNNNDKLSKLQIANFQTLVDIGLNTKHLRPTLYDLLAYEAIETFFDTETNLPKVAYPFLIDSEIYFKLGTNFLPENVVNDTNSHALEALKIYKSLLELHEKSKNYDAVAEIEYHKLYFISTRYTKSNKDSLHFETINKLYKKYESTDMFPTFCYDIAQHYNTLQDYHKALQFAKQGAEYKTTNSGTISCEALIKEIKRVSIKIQTELVIPENAATKALVTYKNTDKMYLRIYKTDFNYIHEKTNAYRKAERYNYPFDKLFCKELKSQPYLLAKEYQLPLNTDFKTESVEIILPKLNNGIYYLMCSNDPSFDASQTLISGQIIQVTNTVFSYHTSLDNSKYEFSAYDRLTGNKIKGGKIEVSTMEDKPFDSYRYYQSIIQPYKTVEMDANGNFNVELINNIKYQNSNKNIILKYTDLKGKTFYSFIHSSEYSEDLSLYYYKYNDNDNDNVEDNDVVTITQIYTDRAIYRPGQEVFFKGITYIHDRSQKRNYLDTNKTYTITFYDANSQEVSNQTVKTNSFGSYTGVFHIPTGLMNGSFTISDGYTSKQIKVEEYVRPKFIVALQKPEKSFIVNEMIPIKGTATAYNTSAISGAKVAYTVVRKPRYPRWCYSYWFNYIPQTPQVIIESGQVQTNSNGEFTINFKAVPDASIDPQYEPIFDYEIKTDVTDINGETQSISIDVSVSYNYYRLDIFGANDWQKGQDPVIQFSLNNQNGIPQKGKIKLTIEKFAYNQSFYRTQLWETPTKQVIDEQEFKKLFPFDKYHVKVENLEDKLDKEILSKEYNETDTIDLKTLNLDAGKYKFTATTLDPTGKEVRAIYWADMSDYNSDVLLKPETLTINYAKGNCKPGDQAKIKLLSSFPNIKVNLEIFDDKGLRESRVVVLNKKAEFLEFATPKIDYYSKLTIKAYAFYDNRHYVADAEFDLVPERKEVVKSLQIKTESFRSSLYPGAKEKFTINIKGSNTSNQAEVLAFMYDASLDAIYPYSFDYFGVAGFASKYTYAKYWSRGVMNNFGSNIRQLFTDKHDSDYKNYNKRYPSLNWFGYYFGFYNHYYRHKEMRKMSKSAPMRSADAPEMVEEGMMMDKEVVMNSSATYAFAKAMAPESDAEESSPSTTKPPVQIRKNLKETAFFYPQLHTNAQGDVQIEFTSPEALTKWNVNILAHNKELASSMMRLETVTKKELMVTANMPRFFRVTDHMTLSFKISNTTAQALNGTAKLILKDAYTLKEINTEFANTQIAKPFAVNGMENTEVSWNIEVPENYDAVVWTVTAETNTHSDGEEAIVPILKLKDLVIASQPLYVRGGQTKKFEFKHLKDNNSKTLRHHKLTAEFTTQPAWYAVQALPYLMEYDYESNNALFNRYYANSLASYIANSDVRIRAIFDTWKATKSDALVSNLEKNQDLKYLTLQETPWVLDGKDETTQKRNIGLLFDKNTLSNNLKSSIEKLAKNQLNSGAWSWMDADVRYPDRYITQYIVTGLARLIHISAIPTSEISHLQPMITSAVAYLDDQLEQDYANWKRYATNDEYYLNSTHVQYFYMRQLLQLHSTLPKAPQHYEFFLTKVEQHAVTANIQLKAYCTMVLMRANKTKKTADLVKSIQEHFINSEEFGTYFKESYSDSWYQRPVETQCAVIELFDNLLKDKKTADDLKIWLLKQKQTNRWETSTATAEAVYAIINQGTDFLSLDDQVTLEIGKDIKISTNSADVKAEAGTGYVRKDFAASEINNQMGNIQFSKKGNSIAWGAVTWQYFEDIDKVKPNQAGIAVLKEYYLVTQTPTGEKLVTVNNNQTLKVGDELVVRLVLKTDRTYNYVLLKDHRPAGTEPTTQISGYASQDGLWYYQSMKDASSQFFMSYLDKGTHVFEYRIRASRKGDYAAGYAAMQCMYAPEFNGHSKGLRLKIE